MLIARLRVLLILGVLAVLCLAHSSVLQATPSIRVTRHAPLTLSTYAPGTITTLGTYNTPSYAARVHVVDTLAYVADGSGGLQVLDVTNPVSPTFVASYSSPGYCADVQVSGNLAYLDYVPSSDQAELRILEISDPHSPQVLSSTPTNRFTVFQVADGFAYLAETNALLTIDVRNPRQPIVRSRVALDDLIEVRDIQVVGRFVYLVGHNYRDGILRVVDVSDPKSPVLRGAVRDSNGGPTALAVADGMAYVPLTMDGNAYALSIIDLNDPDHPMLRQRHVTGEAVTDLNVIGAHAYVGHSRLGGGYLEVLDLANPAAPTTLARGGGLTDVPNIQVIGDHIYVADGRAGLKILEANLPQSPNQYQVFLPAIVH